MSSTKVGMTPVKGYHTVRHAFEQALTKPRNRPDAAHDRELFERIWKWYVGTYRMGKPI